MATKSPDPLNSLGRQLNFATGRMNALCQTRLAPHDLSLPQWVILSCLWREGELTVGALSRLIGNGLPATSRILDRMVDRDLIARRPDAADGRGILVRVTPKGQALDHLRTFHDDINSVLLDGFTRQERDQIFDLLQRIERNAVKALD